MIECVPADVLGACDDAALDAQCLGVRANLEGDSSLQSEVRDYPAAISEDPFAVAVVDEDHGVVLLGELGYLVQPCDVAVHTEHAVGDNQFSLAARVLPQDLL